MHETSLTTTFERMAEGLVSQVVVRESVEKHLHLLKTIARSRHDAATGINPSLYGLAMGLASTCSRFLRRHIAGL